MGGVGRIARADKVPVITRAERSRIVSLLLGRVDVLPDALQLRLGPKGC